MDELLNQFTVFMTEEKGASKNTVLSYRRDLKALLEYFSAHGITDLKQVGPGELRTYANALHEAGKSASTVSRSIASIKAFFAYLVKEGSLLKNPADGLKPPKVVKKAPTVLDDAEVERLLQQPETDSAKGIRDRAMLELLYATGLRVSELLALRLKDVNLRQHMLIVSSSGKTRFVPFDRRSTRYLNLYLGNAREVLIQANEAEALFVNCQGECMTRQGFWKLIKKYGHDAGLSTELTPHVMRHSFAVHALKCGEDIHKVQSILGHSDVATTHAYIGI